MSFSSANAFNRSTGYNVTKGIYANGHFKNGHDTPPNQKYGRIESNGHVIENGKAAFITPTQEAILSCRKIKDIHSLSLFELNKGITHRMKALPLPPSEGMPVPIPGGWEEPEFDENLHLNLGKPDYVRILGLKSFEKRDANSKYGARADIVGPATNYRSQFAYSAPFQLLSDEGIQVLRKIIDNSKAQMAGDPTSARGNKVTIRGLYYSSKWVQDLQNCPTLRNHFEAICGEELVPHPSFSNSPQVNISHAGGTKGPVDHWHWDSVAYTGVIVLSDMSEMVGGNLEIAMMDKQLALEKVARKEHVALETVKYCKPGKMILAQGAEILHHVTPVESKNVRISVIFGFAPANCFQPAKLVLNTMRKLEAKHQLGDYEYFRENAWQALNVLEHYLKNVKYTNDAKKLGEKMKVLGEFLTYHGMVLNNEINDEFLVMDECAGKLVTDFNHLSAKPGHNDRFEHNQ